jgi:hypothetical protein
MKRNFAYLLGSAIALTAGIAIAQESAPLPTKKPKLPASADATPGIKPFEFMTGRWIGLNPNGTVNEEHWMTPRGTTLLGTFRQIRRDGRPALVELSMIADNKDGITLSLRHLHTNLEVPENQKELSIFKLKSVTKNRAEFVGTGGASTVASVVYERIDKIRLTQEVKFDPKTKDSGYKLVYFKE